MSTGKGLPGFGPHPEIDVVATPTVQIGTFKITGIPAFVVQVALFAAVGWLIARARPSPGMIASGLVWLGFLVFWSATVGREGTGTLAETPQQRARRRLLSNVALVLLFVPIPGLRWPLFPARWWTIAIALGLEAFAVLLHVSARRHLGRNWSGTVMIKADHQLVTSGPYRLIRHPIYTAILALAGGTAMVSAQLHAALGFAVFAFVYWRKLRLEEARLAETFGNEWSSYRKRSWALVPGLV